MRKQDFLSLDLSEKIKYVKGETTKKDEVSKPRKNKKLQKQKQQLKKFADQIIGEYSNKKKAEIISQLQNITGVNSERAENGFNKMIDYKILSYAPTADRYYLSGSLPF